MVRGWLLSVALVACDRVSASEPSRLPARSASPGATAAAVLGSFNPCKQCLPPVKTGTIGSPDIIEASGLAASSLHADVYYVHNDSGDTPRFFAIDSSGKEIARYDVDGAFAIDWEDAAAGPCPEGHCLFFADFGDNDSQRPSYTIYRVAEPALVEPGEHHLASVPLSFRYPDGSHDAETLLVHPHSGEVVVVTKAAGGPSGVYRFPLPLTPASTVTLQKIGSVLPPAGIARITGGAIHPKGSGILLRSYTHAFYYPLAGDIAAALAATPCSVPVALEQQGEAIEWTRAGDGYVTVSEGASVAVNYVACP